MKLITECIQNISRVFKSFRHFHHTSKMSEAAQPNKINTLVFFDTETTGLPGNEWGRTKITELSLCAARAYDLSKLTSGLPRVINKLSLCLNPQKTIDSKASEITGLNNELLECYGGFDERVFTMIENFLLRLPQPVCLLAHNGNRFDFPILRAELKHINKKLPHDLLCADTLSCFRQLYSVNNAKKKLFGNDSKTKSENNAMEIDGIQPLSPVKNASSVKNLSTNEKPTKSLEYDALSDEWDIKLIKLAEKFDQEIPYYHRPSSSQQSNEQSPVSQVSQVSHLTMQQINETTPKSQMVFQQVTNTQISIQNVNETTPTRPIIVDRSSMFKVKPKSFRLGDVYAHVTQSSAPLNLHSAEADTLALLECAVGLGPHFIDWIESNAVPFNQQ